uniref:Uncharacterized protein n=1 Tax=Timema cristinae TaxID=61476 RepID=A0A7R9CRM4_TIMCR|nr:unnamed protein product [Timema cristinae]
MEQGYLLLKRTKAGNVNYKDCGEVRRSEHPPHTLLITTIGTVGRCGGDEHPPHTLLITTIGTVGRCFCKLYTAVNQGLQEPRRMRRRARCSPGCENPQPLNELSCAPDRRVVPTSRASTWRERPLAKGLSSVKKLSNAKMSSFRSLATHDTRNSN